MATQYNPATGQKIQQTDMGPVAQGFVFAGIGAVLMIVYCGAVKTSLDPQTAIRFGIGLLIAGPLLHMLWYVAMPQRFRIGLARSLGLFAGLLLSFLASLFSF